MDTVAVVVILLALSGAVVYLVAPFGLGRRR